MSSRGTAAWVHLNALASNLSVIRGRLGLGAFVCPMVKANAYGHGAVPIARKLSELKVDALGVVTLEEAMEIREAGVLTPLLVFGTPCKIDIQQLREQKLTLVVSEMAALRWLSKSTQAVHFHLKFNTGMNRMGFHPAQAEEILSLVHSNKMMRLKGLCTHFFNGEDIADDQGHSRSQIQQMRKVYEVFKNETLIWHLYNSSALFRTLPAMNSDPFLKIQGARPGISLYGETPYSQPLPEVLPVLSITSQISHMHRLQTGEWVSYGARWKALRPSVIGVIPMGYADGYPRVLTNNSFVLIQGHRVPVVGTVCMDFIMVDLTDHPQLPALSLGQSVTILGREGDQQISAFELAERAGTIPYEILTKIGSRLPRNIVTEGFQ